MTSKCQERQTPVSRLFPLVHSSNNSNNKEKKKKKKKKRSRIECLSTL